MQPGPLTYELPQPRDRARRLERDLSLALTGVAP